MAKPSSGSTKAQYEAAERFMQTVLVDRDSLFTPGQPVWADATVTDLYRRFVEHPDLSAESFEKKFERQLAGAPPATYQLAGELLYVHLLPGNSTGGAHKRKLINTVLGWSSLPCAIPPELDKALDRGLAAEGMAYKIHRPFLLHLLLEFVRKWWSLEESDRQKALKDPWAFKKVVATVKVPKAQSQAEILLHLVHPASFEDIMSRAHKRDIAEAFASRVPEGEEDVDRALLAIRRALEAEEGRSISFYEPRFIAAWQPDADPWTLFVKHAGAFFKLAGFDAEERDYKIRLAAAAKPAVQQMLADPGATGEELQKVFKGREQNLVRWQDYDPFMKWYRSALPTSHKALTGIAELAAPTEARIRALLDEVPKSAVKSNASRTTVASFFLAAFDPLNFIVFRASPFAWAYERVGFDTPAKKADEVERYMHAIAFVDRFLDEARRRGVALRDRLDAQGLIWMMARADHAPDGMDPKDWEAFLKYREGSWVPDDPDTDEEGRAEPKGPSVEADALGRLILARKNVALYGPPGTGKTHASLRVADLWRKAYGAASVLQVTFHPTFAYEDFIEGFRPDASGRFELRKGIFLRACEAAQSDAGRPHLLVIDELNRGDVARIFGELITLLEADKRHSGVSRRLPYSQLELWVPPNLHLLATMNTADRSVSLLDVAIRRRFCFVEYRPAASVIANSEAHHREVGDVDISEVMEATNRRLLAIGIDRERAVGHSYFLIAASEKSPLSVLRDRFRYDVLPLVEEYCYADRSLMRRVFGQLVTEQGDFDSEVLADDQAFLDALRALCDSVTADGQPGASLPEA